MSNNFTSMWGPLLVNWKCCINICLCAFGNMKLKIRHNGDMSESNVLSAS